MAMTDCMWPVWQTEKEMGKGRGEKKIKRKFSRDGVQAPCVVFIKKICHKVVMCEMSK